MKYYNKITPEGTKDLLSEDCARRAALSGVLKELYRSWGYRRVMTPMLEFYDVYGHSASCLPAESMYKLTDAQGRLMVLCPDCTVPIARLAATRLKGAPLPLRLFYSHNIYRRNPELKGRSAEIHQMGIELIGSAALKSDLEAVELAAESLEQTEAGYRLELCHIGYFKALLDSLGADEETEEAIRMSVERKNYASLTELLAGYAQNPAAEALKKLPGLFGGVEVLDCAYELFHENRAEESLRYLRTVYEHLQGLGIGDKVMIDLGLVNQAEYYTGIIFRGYLDGIGEQVLSGGRYDRLLRDFGEDLPAVGFAVNLEPASQKIAAAPEPAVQALVYADGESRLAEAGQLLRSLREAGIRAENSVEESEEAAKEHARAAGIPELYIVGSSVRKTEIKKEGTNT